MTLDLQISSYNMTPKAQATKNKEREKENQTSSNFITFVYQMTLSRKCKDNLQNGRKYLQIIYQIGRAHV